VKKLKNTLLGTPVAKVEFLWIEFQQRILIWLLPRWKFEFSHRCSGLGSALLQVDKRSDDLLVIDDLGPVARHNSGPPLINNIRKSGRGEWFCTTDLPDSNQALCCFFVFRRAYLSFLRPFEFWWTRWDSNPRPPHCERGKI